MSKPSIVSHAQWLEARKELLEAERVFTQARDALGEQIRALPWEKVEKDYVFDGPDGPESLSDLFAGASQLIVYHFMFDPDWQDGCKSCSLLADHFDRLIVHLKARDVTMLAASRASLSKLDAFKQRMGWGFKWVSSGSNDFNFDYHVSFTPERIEQDGFNYNYAKGSEFSGTELPGLSVFFRDENGEVFHTYSSYARGLETFLGIYRMLDIVPKGRDEDDLPYGMDWVRLHDSYEAG